ncbi:MAG: M48 family metallopeptidase [Bacteroidota bacterium]
MKALWLSVFMLVMGTTCLHSQELDTSPLESAGTLPEEVVTSPAKKYRTALRNYRVGDNDSQRNQFLLESTYVLDQLLRSGYVLYNDPVGAYVNDVMETVIAANPSIREKEPRAYVLKTSEVNAFALDQGIVFVSLGLLAQLENEAQLAFVLSHELVHIIEGHVMDSFVEDMKIDNSVITTKDRDGKQFDLAETMKNQYSREQEMSADQIGAEYFLKTNYDFTSIVRVFDVLRYGHLPFDEVPFELEYLQELSVTLPAKCVIEEIAPITPPEEDEENSTHPAIDSRIIKLRDRLTGLDNAGRQEFLVSSERFEMARQRARVTLPRLFLEEQQLSEAIYTGFLLEKTYGENAYAKEVVGKALYGWARFRSNGQSRDVNSPRWKKVQGESQALFHAINKMNAEELTLLAITYNYARYQQEPNNKETKAILIDLFGDLYLEHDIESLDYFKMASSVGLTERTSVSSEEEETEEETGSENKLDKIQRNQQREGYEDVPTVWDKTMFTAVLNDSDFRALAGEGFDYGKERQAEIDFYEPETNRERTRLRKYQKQRQKRGVSLGIKRVTVVNPVFIHLDQSGRNDYSMDFEKSEAQQQLMNDVLADCAKDLGVSMRTLDPAKLRADDVNELNDIAVASSWVSTQLDAEDFIYQAYNRADMEDFAERYNSRYVMSVIAISVAKRGLLAKLFSSGESLLLVAVFDTETGRRSYVKSEFIQFYLDRAFLQSEMYDALNQVVKSN